MAVGVAHDGFASSLQGWLLGGSITRLPCVFHAATVASRSSIAKVIAAAAITTLHRMLVQHHLQITGMEDVTKSVAPSTTTRNVSR
ncbi:hypothetical protein [Gordonia polyisoprenivorans]|uniref:hypothetical protein n=1 Tax=Gordonia polyisoprenivorans TaxID=84595 RepID=UPI0030D2FA35